MATVIISVVLAVVVFFAARAVFGPKKVSKCSGCSGCSTCESTGSCHGNTAK